MEPPASAGETPRDLHWPPGRAPNPEEGVRTSCAACSARWLVHRSMCGFRLRCTCGAWIAVPVELRNPRLGSGAVDALGAPNSLPERVELAKQSALVIEPSATAYVEAPPLGTAAPAGALEDAHPTARARWTNRMGLEVAALGLAILGPPALAYGLSRAKEDVPLLPFASIASALLVLVLSAAIGGYAVVGLCGARVRYWVEASLTALLAFGFAMAWVWVAKHALPDSAADDAQLKALRRALGFGWSAVVVALVPALVEEIAFRGVLQGRTSALFGARAGWLVTALAFALCHFAPAVLPIHLGLGLYLGWLRTRSESLVPGMLLHALYNTLVLLADG